MVYLIENTHNKCNQLTNKEVNERINELIEQNKIK